MDTATAITIGKKVYKMAKKTIKYIREDNESFYGLDEEVSVVLAGNDVAIIRGNQLAVCDTADGSLSISAVWSNGWLVRLTAHPFPASAHLWNGPDVIANNQYRSMLASLFHDLIWEHGDELAQAWGVTKQDVLRWGDGVLYALWMYASEDSMRGRIEARVAWSVCEFSRGWYHSLKKLLGLHCLAFALLLAGCGTPPDWTVAEITGTNAVLRAMGKTTEIAQGEGAATPTQPDGPSGIQPSASPASSDAVDFASLNWSYGGFSGKNAKLAEGAEIGALMVTAGGMSYKWVKGGCEQLGASSATDASCLACVFCLIDGKWKGGKADWVSTSRTTRDFANIYDGYNGWDKQAISKATAYAFVIVSKDGKKRTNTIKAVK